MARGPIPDLPMARPTVPEVTALARAYYAKPGHELGGNLHIVLEDENLSDDHVCWCIREARQQEDADGEALGLKILALSGTQRRRLVSLL